MYIHSITPLEADGTPLRTTPTFCHQKIDAAVVAAAAASELQFHPN